MRRLDSSDTARWVVGVDSQTMHMTTPRLAADATAGTLGCVCPAVLWLPPTPPRSLGSTALRFCDECLRVWTAFGPQVWTSATAPYPSWLAHAVRP